MVKDYTFCHITVLVSVVAVAKDADKHRGDMEFLIKNPESFYSVEELEMYSYQMCNANRKYVAEMAKTLKGNYVGDDHF